MRHAAFSFLTLLILLLTACSIEVETRPSSHHGHDHDWAMTKASHGERYESRITGSILDEPFEAEVILDLEEDDRFHLRVEIEADGEVEIETVDGTYRIEGTSLELFGGDHGVMRFRIRGDDLIHRSGWVWEFAHHAFRLPHWSMRRIG